MGSCGSMNDVSENKKNDDSKNLTMKEQLEKHWNQRRSVLEMYPSLNDKISLTSEIAEKQKRKEN